MSFFFAGFNIKENQVFNEKDNRSQIVFIAEKELGDVDIDLIGILEDLPKLTLHSSMRNMGILKQSIDESISSISTWNIMN